MDRRARHTTRAWDGADERREGGVSGVAAGADAAARDALADLALDADLAAFLSKGFSPK